MFQVDITCFPVLHPLIFIVRYLRSVPSLTEKLMFLTTYDDCLLELSVPHPVVELLAA